MNRNLNSQPPAVQFLMFLGLATCFFFLNALVFQFFFHGLGDVFTKKTAEISYDTMVKFKWANAVGAVISFVLPAICFGYVSSKKALPYVGAQKSLSVVLALASVLLLLIITPFASWLGTVNARLNFADLQYTFQPLFNSLENLFKVKIDIASMQKPVEQAEETYNKTLEIFLKMRGTNDLLLNLFIMALLPAFSEELFFRGALQRSLLRLSNKPWLAIVVSSTIFALLHGTIFKILPIFFLGIILGTVYYYTKNLWYNVIIHFLNNAIALFAYYFANRSETINNFSKDNYSVPILIALASLTLSLGIIHFIHEKSRETVFINEDTNLLS